ncbi:MULTISPECIES: Rieske (2Fe-2S) protein [unclassified Streptomyces]|uniref:Rieske (2Fe-2S) protein n=1 Tax=unclassified Streptomyces TaxID=2593676 RepID=UPI00344C35C6
MSASPDRRTVLRGAALAGIACFGAAACAGGEQGTSARPSSDAPVELGPATEVPVGGAKLYAAQRLLVSQPAKGEFKCFSSVCTHMGAVLNKIEKGQAICPLHGSHFQVADGKVAQGPAAVPLESVPIKVKGGKLIAG